MRRIVRVIVGLIVVGLVVPSLAAEPPADWQQQLDALKQRIARLEQSAASQESESQEHGQMLKELATVRKTLGALEFAIGITGVLQATQGADHLSEEGDVTDATMSLDVEVGADLWEGASGFVHIEAGNGDGVDGDVETLSGLNDDADDDATLRLTEAWLEQRWWDERVALRIGKIDLCGGCGMNECAFDGNAVANDETAQFLSTGFVNNIAVDFPEDNGFGAEIWLAPCSWLDVGVAIAEADADWDNVFDDLFYIGQVNLKPTLWGRPGTYRFFAWRNDTDHELLTEPVLDPDDPFLDDSAPSNDNAGKGLGVSCDQELADGLTAFFRYAVQDHDIYMVERAWSAGFQIDGKSWARPDDVLGAAYGVAELGCEGAQIVKAELGNPKDEIHIELYYNIFANDHLQISPDVQYVRNAMGSGTSDTFWTFALRAQLGF